MLNDAEARLRRKTAALLLRRRGSRAGELRVANPAEPNAPRILGPAGPDGLPLGDPNAAAPDLTLSPGEGAPKDRLQDLLANANSFGGERE